MLLKWEGHIPPNPIPLIPHVKRVRIVPCPIGWARRWLYQIKFFEAFDWEGLVEEVALEVVGAGAF